MVKPSFISLFDFGYENPLILSHHGLGPLGSIEAATRGLVRRLLLLARAGNQEADMRRTAELFCEHLMPWNSACNGPTQVRKTTWNSMMETFVPNASSRLP